MRVGEPRRSLPVHPSCQQGSWKAGLRSVNLSEVGATRARRFSSVLIRKTREDEEGGGTASWEVKHLAAPPYQRRTAASAAGGAFARGQRCSILLTATQCGAQQPWVGDTCDVANVTHLIVLPFTKSTFCELFNKWLPAKKKYNSIQEMSYSIWLVVKFERLNPCVYIKTHTYIFHSIGSFRPLNLKPIVQAD